MGGIPNRYLRTTHRSRDAHVTPFGFCVFFEFVGVGFVICFCFGIPVGILVSAVAPPSFQDHSQADLSSPTSPTNRHGFQPHSDAAFTQPGGLSSCQAHRQRQPAGALPGRQAGQALLLADAAGVSDQSGSRWSGRESGFRWGLWPGGKVVLQEGDGK